MDDRAENNKNRDKEIINLNFINSEAGAIISDQMVKQRPVTENLHEIFKLNTLDKPLMQINSDPEMNLPTEMVGIRGVILKNLIDKKSIIIYENTRDR